MSRPTVSLLVDARARPPGPLALPPGVEAVVAGPGQPVDLPESAPEGVLFHALVSAARAPLCVWLRAGDQMSPQRIDHLRTALVRLQVPIVGHLPPNTAARGSGRVVRIPAHLVTKGTTVVPDTLAFRHDIAAFAPKPTQHPHGTRRALLNWAAVRDSVGFVDRPLLTRPPAPAPTPAHRIRSRVIATQAAFTALATLQELDAPQPLVAPAIQLLLDRSQTWTWNHWELLQSHKRPHWSPPENPA